jgi:uncharacterized protein YidB (DUF937 family)
MEGNIDRDQRCGPSTADLYQAVIRRQIEADILDLPRGRGEHLPIQNPKEKTMSQGMPSMTALLGMVALAGFQNRDKIAEMLKGTGSSDPGSGAGQSGLGGLLGSLSGMLGAGAGAGSTGTTGSAGGFVSNGLNEMLESFKENGHGDTAESWINPGPNKEISPPQLKQALGSDVLTALEQKTGLSQHELLARLSRDLPSAIDKYTPDGRLPSA